MSQMRLAASLLVKYNGGQSCVQSFVAQHAFFVEPVQVDTIRSQYHPSRMVTHLDLGKPPHPDEALMTVYEQIAQTAEADWQYLEAVFEEPVAVMNYLMQRIFREPVQVHIDEILKQARTHSELAYLRALFATYQATSTLVKRLCTSYARHIKESAARSSEIADVGVDETIASVTSQLQGLMEDLFSQYLKPELYLTLEQRASQELYTMAITPLLNYLQTRKSSSRGVISSVFGRGSTSLSTSSSPRGSTTTAPEMLILFADGQPLIRKGEGEDGIANEVVVNHCLALHAELASRLFLLAPAEQRGSALEQSMKTLFHNILEKYVEASLECAIEFGDTSNGFDPKSFAIIQSSCRILSVVLNYSHRQFLPLIVTASSISYRNMIQGKMEAAGRVTERIDQLLRKELDGSLKWIEDQLLSKQKKSDFKPRPDDLEALVGASQACEATCQFVSKLTKEAISKLDNANATTFSAELGAGLHQLLLDHLKNFTISDSGAMILQNDLKKYRSMVDELAPAAHLLRDRFDMLWELGHLYVVRPENLRSVLQEGHLGRVDVKLIYPYIAQRADFAQSKIDLLFPDMEKSFSRLFL